MRCIRGRLATLLMLAVALVVVLGASGASLASVVAVDYRLPVDGEVLQGFEPPKTVYGPGHRGVDLAADPGEEVGAAAPGTVAHAGSVAGTVWVSLDHADGVRTTYGPMSQVAVEHGEQVTGGQRLGVLAAAGHGHEGQDAGLHLSARRDGAYLDPMTLLASGLRPSLVAHDRRAVTDHHDDGGPSPPTVARSGNPAAVDPRAEGELPEPPARRSAPGPPVPAQAAPGPSP